MCLVWSLIRSKEHDLVGHKQGYWNPTNSTQIPENQKPPQTQKLRNSNSETLKVRVSEFPRHSFRVSEAEFPSRTISGSFGVGTQSPKHYVYSGRTRFGSFRAGFFRTKSGNSETPPQKLKNTNSEIGFPSFRVGLSEFPSQTFRVSEVEGFPCREGPCRFHYIGATQSIPGSRKKDVAVAKGLLAERVGRQAQPALVTQEHRLLRAPSGTRSQQHWCVAGRAREFLLKFYIGVCIF